MDNALPTKSGLDTIPSGDYNHVPIMIGYTSKEMLFMEVRIAVEAMGFTPRENKTPSMEDAIPWQINLERGSDTSKLICQKLTDLYFSGPDAAEGKYLIGTDGMVVGILASIKQHLVTSEKPIYFNRMSLDAGLNIAKNLGKLNDHSGACHCDDLGYLFKTDMTPEFKPGSLEDKSVRRFVKLWTNFAKYGNPTPNLEELGIIWEPVKEETVNFLDIGEELTLNVDPEANRIALWREIYQLNQDLKDFL